MKTEQKHITQQTAYICTYSAGLVEYTARGHTGHEHLDMFGLINMNGRMYDYALGRFLSPDPYVPDATYTQDFNRYSYARNNPLSYTDPTGEFIWAPIIFAAVVAGSMNLVMNGPNIESFGQGLAYFGVGAAVGAGAALAGGWAATLIPSGILAGAGVGALSGAVVGGASGYLLNGGNNLIAGNNFNMNWEQNTLNGAIFGAIGGAIGGGIQGYRSANAAGKNLWWGNDIKYGRNKWSFFTSEKPYETIRWDLRNIGSQNLNDCVPTSFAEANDFFGGNTSYRDYLERTGYISDVGVESNKGLYEKMLGKNFGGYPLDNPYEQLKNKDAILNIKNGGNLIHTNMPLNGMRHADNLRSISYYHSGKVVLNYRFGSYKLSPEMNNWWFYILSGGR